MDSHHPTPFHPPRRVRLLTFLFVAGVAAMVVSACGYLYLQGPIDRAIDGERRLVRNTGRLLTLDEIVESAARLGALTGDPAYQVRHDAHADQLEALLVETLALVDDREVGRAVDAAEEADVRLAEVERRAFALVGDGRRREALALLDGQAYRDDTARYDRDMQRAFDRMEVVTAARRHAIARRARLLEATAILALVLVFTIWLLELRARRRQTAAYAAQLEITVAERTAELARRNHDLRLVLDHVSQGFATIDTDGVLAAERSAVVDRWLGPAAPGVTLAAQLRPHAPEPARWLELGLDELRAGVMPAELVIDQLPRRFTAGARTFTIDYRPITAGGAIGQLLVIIDDVTASIAHQRIEREQQELVALFQRISIDRLGVEEFLADAAGLVDALRHERDPQVQQRLVHTLKGNCAVYGLETYAEATHAIESELGETGGALTDRQRETLVGLWKQAMARVAPLLGSVRRDVVEIGQAELDAALVRARGLPALQELLRSWTRQPLARRFERMTRQMAGLSRRLGRPAPTVETSGGELRLDQPAWQPFWSAMVHVARNAIDHGIEDVDQRRRAGKPEAGVIVLAAERRHGRLDISVSDDGRGIDWAEVRARARALGLADPTDDDLVAALFVDGLTTAAAPGELSGRGVGLSALAEVVRALGGAIAVESTAGEGTTFRFSFDEARLPAERPAAGAASRSPPPSLLPFAS